MKRTLTRATTIAKALDDTTGLIEWKREQTLRGVAASPDLQALLASVGAKAPKGQIREIAQQGEDRAAASSAANMGTAIHAVVGLIIAGDNDALALAPESVRRDAQAVVDLLTGLGLQPVVLEQFVVVSDLDEAIGGSFDILAINPRGRSVIVDVKTIDAGTSLANKVRYSGLAWAIQEAIYSHGTPYVGEIERDRWTRPVIDDEAANFVRWASLADRIASAPDMRHGLIVAVGRGTGVAQAVRTDLQAGWEAAAVAVSVRSWRKAKIAEVAW